MDIKQLLNKVHVGDCLDGMKLLPDNCIDSVVTDPPYGLNFMSAKWDYEVPQVEIWKEALRVLKPGGNLLSFFGTRTYHRGVVNIEDAGFEIRDQIGWLYASGFPKSQNISKAIDKTLGLEREKVRTPMGPTGNKYAKGLGDGRPWMDKAAEAGYHEHDGDIPVSEQAKKFQGFGSALKPAWEPIVLARKPLDGTLAENVLKWGTGGLNIDACRIPTSESLNGGAYSGGERKEGDWKDKSGFKNNKLEEFKQPIGRYPANVIHDGSDQVVSAFPAAPGQMATSRADGEPMDNQIYGAMNHGTTPMEPREDDTKSAARFYFCAKASKQDRHEDLSGRNTHNTVKPTELMQYLCRLVTPKEGIILDPFSGSGSTGKGALLECFSFIGFEKDPDFVEIANARLKFIKGQPGLFL